MRFETRFDGWLVAVLILAAVISCGYLPALHFLAPDTRPEPPWVSFGPLVIWLIVLPCMLPQYYVVREDGLFIRQGWRKVLLSYESLIEVQPVQNSMSAAVFSTSRILIVTQAGKRFLIAVAEQERFLDEVSKRCSQLERRSGGFGMPLSPPSFV